MKTIPYLSFVIASAFGFFAGNKPIEKEPKEERVTYYCIEKGNGSIFWTMHDIKKNGPWHCQLTDRPLYCTIVAKPGYHPANEQYPDSSKINVPEGQYHSVNVLDE